MLEQLSQNAIHPVTTSGPKPAKCNVRLKRINAQNNIRAGRQKKYSPTNDKMHNTTQAAVIPLNMV